MKVWGGGVGIFTFTTDVKFNLMNTCIVTTTFVSLAK